jgi:hypothetical protein
MDGWAKDCCVSYTHFTIADTSDVAEWDYLATFVFVVYIPICKMIESIKKPTKGKKNGRSKQI